MFIPRAPAEHDNVGGVAPPKENSFGSEWCWRTWCWIHEKDPRSALGDGHGYDGADDHDSGDDSDADSVIRKTPGF